jgi:hypothetical protein
MENKLSCICNKTAKRFCNQCRSYLCNNCTINNHSNHIKEVFKINSLYNTHNFSFINDLFGNDKPISEFKCSIGVCCKESKYLCLTCQMYICDKCLKDKHQQDHNTKSLNDYFDLLKRRTYSVYKIISENILEEAKCFDFDAKIINLDKELSSAHGKVTAKVKQVKADLVSSISKIFEGKRNVIKEYKEKFDSLKALYKENSNKYCEYMNEYEELAVKFTNEHINSEFKKLLERLEYIDDIQERIAAYIINADQVISNQLSLLKDNLLTLKNQYDSKFDNHNVTKESLKPHVSNAVTSDYNTRNFLIEDLNNNKLKPMIDLKEQNEDVISVTSNMSQNNSQTQPDNLIKLNSDLVMIDDETRVKSNTQTSNETLSLSDQMSRRQTCNSTERDMSVRPSVDSNSPHFVEKLDLIKQKTKELKEPDDNKYNQQVKDYLSILSWDERNMLELISLGYNCNTVFIYNPYLRKAEEIEVNFKFPSYHNFINKQPYVYISGGKDTTNQEIAKFHRLKRTGENTFSIDELSSMSVPRSHHVMVSYGANKIIAISGSKVKGCEMYDIETDKWETLPELNSSRERPTACINENLLYVFSGFDKIINKFLNTIERIDLSNPIKWDIVTYSGNQNCLKRFSSSCYLNNNNLYILGGVNSVRNTSKEVLTYSFKTNSVGINKNSLDRAYSFNQTNLVLLNSQIVNLSEESEIVKFELNKFI